MNKSEAIALDDERHEVTIGKKVVRDLKPKEWELFKALFSKPGKVFSRETLLTNIWGHDTALGIDTRTIDQHIARLRVRLGVKPSPIETVTNYGYRFKG